MDKVHTCSAELAKMQKMSSGIIGAYNTARHYALYHRIVVYKKK